VPKSASNLAMKEKMIHSLPGHFTHATSINHNDTLLSTLLSMCRGI